MPCGGYEAPVLWYDNADARRAYVCGAKAAADGLYFHMNGPEIRALEQWLSDLAAWTRGPPPPAPQLWPWDGP